MMFTRPHRIERHFNKDETLMLVKCSCGVEFGPAIPATATEDEIFKLVLPHLPEHRSARTAFNEGWEGYGT
jgi:hypothetical protein